MLGRGYKDHLCQDNFPEKIIGKCLNLFMNIYNERICKTDDIVLLIYFENLQYYIRGILKYGYEELR